MRTEIPAGGPPAGAAQAAPAAAVLRRRRQWRHVRRALVPWLFLAPALVFFTYFKFYPIAHGIRLSFYDVSILGEDRWIGFANLSRAMEDAFLHRAFWHTAVYVVLTVIASAAIAFALALLLEGEARHLRVLRTTLFLPAVVTVAVVAEVWRILYNPDPSGAFNAVAGWVGLGPFGFINDPGTALGSIMVMHVWKSIPYDMVIFVAGLASVDRTLYEAAQIDGAGWLNRLRYVTIPQISFTFTIILVLGVIRGFRVFAEVYAMTGGGPARASEVIMTYIYRVSFIDFDLGYAAALSTLLFLLTAVLTVGMLALRRGKDA